MNTLHTVKKISVLSLLMLAYTSQLIAIPTSGKKDIACQFTQTRKSILALVHHESPKYFKQVDELLAMLHDILKPIKSLVDPRINPGELYVKYLGDRKNITLENVTDILRAQVADKFSDLAEEVGPNSATGKSLDNIADALRKMCGVFETHMNDCTVLQKNDTSKIDLEATKAKATNLYRLQILQKNLSPYGFLMPIELDGLGVNEWKTILSRLC